MAKLAAESRRLCPVREIPRSRLRQRSAGFPGGRQSRAARSRRERSRTHQSLRICTDVSFRRCRSGGLGLGEASAWFDTNVIDGAVNAAGWITRLTATISSWWDKWIIDGIGVNGPAILARMLSYPARLLEWGLVQWYALVMTAGLVGFVFYYVYH